MQGFAPPPPHIIDLERLGDQIAELSAHLDAATARLLELIREFDERGGWGNGFNSCAHWLTWRVGLSPGAAREHVRVARALPALPRIAQALACGELSYSKVRALTRVATSETEARLLAVGRNGTAHHVERIVRGWRRLDRIAEAKEATRRHRARTLRVYQDEDDMVVIHARLEPQYGAVVKQALAAAREQVYRKVRNDVPAGTSHGGTNDTLADGFEDAPTVEQQHADALVMLAESALHHGIDPGVPAERYQVVVHVDAEVLENGDAPGQSLIEDGVTVAAETSQRLACDASRVVMRHDTNGRIIEVNARTKGITLSTGRTVARPHSRISHAVSPAPSSHARGRLSRRAAA